MNKQQITNETGAYFHILLNMADDELDPYEYRLLGHYTRVGKCWEAVRTTATICKMSSGQVVNTREALAKKGYIRLEKRGKDTALVTVLDRMQENVTRYSKCSPGEHDVHTVNTGVHVVNERITIEEQPSKKDIAPAKAVATSEAVNPQIAFSGKENQIVTAQSEKKPQPSKSALEKNPPSAANPPLAPKPVQPHIALIDAWLAALPAKPIGNQYNRNVRVASEMHKAGITPQQITEYVTELYTDVFWQKQTVSMEHIAKNIPQWLTKNAPGKQQWYTHPDPAKRGLRLNEAQYNAAMKELANVKR